MSDSDHPKRPDVLEAEFEPTDGETGAPEENGQAIVLAPQDVADRLATISEKLKGQVPEAALEEIAFLGEMTLATAKHQMRLERQIAEMQSAQEARNRALAVVLAGGDLSEEFGIPVKKEKGPEKLRQLEIETPESIDLVRETFPLTITNSNGEKVQADIRIDFQDTEGNECPVLEAVVNPRETKGGVLKPGLITLDANATQVIAVTLRSKQGAEEEPEPDDIITEQMVVQVALTPTDDDSPCGTEERKFRPVTREVDLNGTISHNDQVELSGDFFDGGTGALETFYAPRLKGVELKDRNNKYNTAFGAGRNLRAVIRSHQIGIEHTETFPTVSARTQKGHIPIKVDFQVKMTVYKKIN